MRIMVIGAPGSGKSRLSTVLAERCGLPLIRLDDHYWYDHWTRPAPDEWAATLESLVAEPRWIIDGNYADSLGVRLDAADLVVLFDIGGVRSTLGLLRRTGRWAWGGRSSLPARIAAGSRQLPPWGNLIPLLRKSATFRRRVLPSMVQQLDASRRPVIVIRGREDAARMLSTVGFA